MPSDNLCYPQLVGTIRLSGGQQAHVDGGGWSIPLPFSSIAYMVSRIWAWEFLSPLSWMAKSCFWKQKNIGNSHGKKSVYCSGGISLGMAGMNLQASWVVPLLFL